MALVVLLRGVNVGGHRTFRPTVLIKQLKHLDAVNIGAAGTVVIRQPVAQARLRAELASRLPFTTEIVICQGREMLRRREGLGPRITGCLEGLRSARWTRPTDR